MSNNKLHINHILCMMIEFLNTKFIVTAKKSFYMKLDKNKV